MPTVTSRAGTTPVDLHVEDSGGDGRPVVLIHGWPLSGASWAAQVPALTEAGHRVVTYDRRGFGASDKPEDGYDYDTFAGDLDAVLTDLDLRDVALVGFSMGGGEVARYVGRFGTDRSAVGGLRGGRAPVPVQDRRQPRRGRDDALVEGMQGGIREDRAGFFEGFAKSFYSAGDDLKVGDDELERFQELMRPARDEAVLGCIDAFVRTDFRADLEKVDVPALVLHGDSDAIVPFEVAGSGRPRRSARPSWWWSRVRTASPRATPTW